MCKCACISALPCVVTTQLHKAEQQRPLSLSWLRVSCLENTHQMNRRVFSEHETLSMSHENDVGLCCST